MWIFFWKEHSCTFNKGKEKLETKKYSWHWMFIFQGFFPQFCFLFFIGWETSTDLSVVNLFSLTHSTGTSFKFLFFFLSRTTPAESCQSFRRRHFRLFTKAEQHVQALNSSWNDQGVNSGHHLQHIRGIPNTMALEQAHQNSETA